MRSHYSFSETKLNASDLEQLDKNRNSIRLIAGLQNWYICHMQKLHLNAAALLDRSSKSTDASLASASIPRSSVNCRQATITVFI